MYLDASDMLLAPFFMPKVEGHQHTTHAAQRQAASLHKKFIDCTQTRGYESNVACKA
jgi:hypothetical protein